MQLIPLHTFGAYYNSAGEALFTGAFLGIGIVGVCGLSVLELSIIASFATLGTVFDHCQSEYWGATEPSHHEIHHNVCSDCNFAQTFSPFLDYVFGTRYEDVLVSEMGEEGGGSVD